MIKQLKTMKTEEIIKNTILSKAENNNVNYNIEKIGKDYIINIPFSPLSQDITYEIKFIFDNNKIYRTSFCKNTSTYKKLSEITKEELTPNSTYTKEEAYSKLENLLGIDRSYFEISDNLKNFVLVNKKEKFNLVIKSKFNSIENLDDIRGLLIDLDEEFLISKSYQTSSFTISDHLYEEENFVKTENGDVIFNKSNLEIKKCFKGVLFRISKYKNIIFKSTNKSIIPYRSKWNYSKYFYDIYEEAKSFNDKELFNDEEETSPFCYLFTAMDSSLIMSSRQRILKPFLVHIMTYEMMENKNNVKPWIGNYKEVEGLVDEKLVHYPSNISIEEANEFLEYGYYNNFDIKDNRLKTGEAIFINDNCGNKYIIESKSYNWRKNIINKNCNYSNFVKVTEESHKRFENEKFKNKYILFKQNFFLKDLFTLYGNTNSILDIPTELYNEVPNNQNEKLKIIFFNFLIASPFDLQPLVINFYKNFLKDKKELLKWIYLAYQSKGLDKNGNPYDPIEYKRLLLIINSVRNSIMKENPVFVQKKVKSYIFNIINKEYGTSLYKLIRQKNLEL